MLSDLITEPTWGITNWQNPVAYSNVDVSSFAWDGPLVTTGQSCLVDQTVPQIISFTYQYRRFTLNGATGVFFFPSGVDLDQLSCGSGTEAQRTVALIFDNPSTSGGLHVDAYVPDQATGTLCGSSVSGPVPGPLGKLALSGQAGLPSGVAHWVVCRMSGGPGPHALMLRLQHLLAARKAFVQVVPTDYCFILERSYLTGGSFGSAVAYAAQMIYPDLFDGAVGVGSSTVCTQAIYGYERAYRAGIGIGNWNRNLMTGGADGVITHADGWYFDQMTKILLADAAKQPPNSASGGLNNMSFLDRLEHRYADDPNVPFLTKPVIVFGGDEDAIAWLHPFRSQLELLRAYSVPGTSATYGDFLKICEIPFRRHSSPAGESDTLHLHPSLYFPDAPAGATTLDWLDQLSSTVDALNLTPQSMRLDHDVPEPNSVEDYRFHEATLASPPVTPIVNGLNLSPLWTDASGDIGYLGTGVAPGLGDHLFAGQLDTDEAIEVIYGEGTGFVHIYEWDSTNLKLNPVWRSPDMGDAVTALDVGVFNKTGGGTEIGVVALSTSGQLWTIRTEASPPVATHHSAWDFLLGGERENPVLAVGANDTVETAVYFSGTSPGPSGPTGDEPNVAQITRLSFTDLTSSPMFDYQEPCDVLTTLHWEVDKLVAGSARGHVFQIEDTLSGFKMRGIENLHVGDYLQMSPRQVLEADIGSGPIYVAVGQPGEVRGAPGETFRNLSVLDGCGHLLVEHHIQNSYDTTKNRPVAALAIIGQSSGRLRVACGTNSIHFFDIVDNSGAYTISAVAKVSGGNALWSSRRYADPGPVLGNLAEDLVSLTSVQDELGRDLLIGGTETGIVFVWDVPSGTTGALPDFPTILDQEQPFLGPTGTKFLDRNLPADNGHGCPTDVKYTLNVLPKFSYAHETQFAEDTSLVDKRESGTVATKVNALTAEVLCRRQRTEEARVFSPDRRNPTGVGMDPLAWDVFWNANNVELNKHVFVETVAVGQLVQVGQYDAVYRHSGLDGKVRLHPDYLNLTATSSHPTGTTFMLDDRYFVESGFGTGMRMANITGTPRGISNPKPNLEAVVATNGGRLVLLDANGEVAKSWQTPSDTLGDYGYKYTGLAAHDIDGDGYDEVFVVGGYYVGTLTNGKWENNSRLLVFDPPATGGGINLQQPDLVVDLGETGCLGLWVGPAFGKCTCTGLVDIVIGRSQTFSVHRVGKNPLSIGPALYTSQGLGAHVGAFNSIEVARSIPAETQGFKRDLVFIGSDAYVYAFTTDEYSIGLH
ncbi:MAG: hypothetical protein RL885_17635 [Planctomycetota bacterium]